MIRRIACIALLAALAPVGASAQSLFSAAGLGSPLEPLDARSLSLGGVGAGLRGTALLATDPSAAAGLLIPTVVFTVQPTWVDLTRSDGEETSSYRGTRFPSLGVAYPVLDFGVATLSLESFLDQRFEARRSVELQLLEGPEPATDEFVSDGGVSRVRLGFARRLGAGVAVGVSVGRYTGSVVRRLVRTVDDTTAVATFEPFQIGGRWSYSGTSVTGGARVSVGEFAEVSGSVRWSGTLEAEASPDTEGRDRSYDIPMLVNVGATAVLAPGLAVNAALSRADWSGVADDLIDGETVGAVTSLGVGVELSRARIMGRDSPLRFGYRRADLPFVLREGAPSESAWTGGVGLALNQVGEIVRASLDLAVERGTREDAAVSESFWRAALTLRVAGF